MHYSQCNNSLHFQFTSLSLSLSLSTSRSQIRNSRMVDLQTVCSMCGDVGFPDKLFRCSKCHHRFQHSYCSSNYSEFSDPIQVCDWCQSEQRSSRHGGSSRKSAAAGGDSGTKRSEYSGDKIKQHDHDGGSERPPPSAAASKNPSGAPSPRPTTRRYKLLKDVMC